MSIDAPAPAAVAPEPSHLALESAAAPRSTSATEPAPESASAAKHDDALHASIGAFAWFEGRFVPFGEANISIATHAFW